MSSGSTSDLRVAESPTGAGRGVFARRVITAGEEIERCPMLYNHSYAPNAETLETQHELVITALRTIREGDEIFINYMGTAQEGVWFDLL